MLITIVITYFIYALLFSLFIYALMFLFVKYLLQHKIFRVVNNIIFHLFLLFVSLVITIGTTYLPTTFHSYLGIVKINCGFPLHYTDTQASIIKDFYKSEEFPVKRYCPLYDFN